MSDIPTGPFSASMMDDSSVGAVARAEAAVAGSRRPDEVGPYRVLELLGEGGMGEVYKAERRHPIRQTVAVKVIKLGFNSREIVGRFESERQALALMDHPGIAKVLDAGTTLEGRPYFVMDFVAGKPITEFCDEHKLSIRDRLTLFSDVCDAIGHAHTKAIIHRDIKPSNVLAYLRDGTPSIKVIDFGVAKALTTARLSELTFNTERGQPIGTYDCMSPEQVDGSPDIDTRTDVYSLGVLLYELLTGAKPFDHTTISNSTDAEIKRIIREVEPPRPSTRLSSLGSDASALAERRQARLDALARQLRGELEWIPLKAMRKERDRRYASPLQFKEDVQNYLDGKPLIAGPESRAYRLKKYVGRHRRGLLIAAAVVTLLMGTFAYYVHSLRVEQAKTRVALVESERQRAESQKQAAIARDSTDFLANIFRNADPGKSFGAQVTVVQTLKDAVRKLDDGSARTEPITEAMVRFVVGTTLQTLGQYDDALPQLRRARELDLKYRSPDDQQIPITLSDLALVLSNQGKFDEAEPLYREVLRTYEAARPPDHPDVGRALSHLGMLLRNQQKFAEAETMLRRSLEIQRKHSTDTPEAIPTALNSLAALYWNQGRLDEAEPLTREVFQLRMKLLPPEHPYIAQSKHNLAAVLKDQKKFDEAEPLAREALALRRKILPPNHPDTATALHTVAGILNGQRRFVEAEPFCRESLQIRRVALPAGHPNIATSASDLAWLLDMQGKFAEAEPLYREALQIRTAKFGAKAAPSTRTAGFLADMLDQADRSAEAASVRTQFALATPSTRPSTAPSR